MSHKLECNKKWEYDKDHCICTWIELAEERIIKLLEENTGCGYEHQETEKCFCEAIALIKGEQK